MEDLLAELEGLPDRGGGLAANSAQALAAQIHSRANAMSAPFAFIGLFELVVWSVSFKRPAYVVLGTEVTDVRELLVEPGVLEEPSGLPAAFVGCRYDGQQSHPAQGFYDLNHWEIGESTGANPVVSPRSHSAGSELPMPLQGPTSGIMYANVLRSKNLRCLRTVCQGDCGIDAMCYHADWERTPGAWGAMRARLSKFMLAVKQIPQWQAIFSNCAENGIRAEGCRLGPKGVAMPSILERFSGFSGAPDVDAHGKRCLGVPLSGPTASDSSPSSGVPARASAGLPPVGATIAESTSSSHGSDGTAPRGDGLAPSPSSSASLAETSPNVGDAPGPAPQRATAASSEKSFAAYLDGLDDVTLQKICANSQAFADAEAKWRSTTPTRPQQKGAVIKTIRKQSTLRQHRLSIGISFERWLATPEAKGPDGQRRPDFLITFIRKTWPIYKEKQCPASFKVWVSRCHGAALKQAKHNGNATAADMAGWHGNSLPRGRVPDKLLRRERGTQGRPYKCANLHDALYDFFIMIRTAVSARISRKMMLGAAKMICSELCKEMKRLHIFEELPVVDPRWLRRWRANFNVSLRKPNRRYKVSRPVLSSRLATMWRNNIRVRALAWFVFKRLLKIYGADQKGVHRNEGGSKETHTLHIKGAGEIPLKENHAATRERISIMTWVSSDRAECDDPCNLPLEIMFKGKTEKSLRSEGLPLTTPRTMRVTVVNSEKGSYRVEHVTKFLLAHLEEWTEARAKSNDWRILYLDAFRPHLDSTIADVAWDRGCVVLYHGGGTTGVAQVNDTDLHFQFEQIYLGCEDAAFLRRQLSDPSDINRTKQEAQR